LFSDYVAGAGSGADEVAVIETHPNKRYVGMMALSFTAILCLVGLIYFPVSQAGFVWVDKIIFHDTAWLRFGDEWKGFIFHNFYEWTNYFRPLVVALFVLEVRMFDVSASPMHLVSLAFHLANTLLVGLLAWNLRDTKQTTRLHVVCFAMLVYGLHPALIEPVVWVSCQFELLVTFFILLTLLINSTVQRATVRAVLVGFCFFLAACAKESAISAPLLLVIFDQLRAHIDRRDDSWKEQIRNVWKQQRLVYAGILFAGFIYLAARYASLGFIVQPTGGPSVFSFARLQEICDVYLTYWRILIWPMTGLGPIHQVDSRQFMTLTPQMLAMDLVAITIVVAAVFLAWKRKVSGAFLFAITAALFPVLHVVPVAFDESLYHERYAMTAVAMGCALLPSMFMTFFLPSARWKRFGVAFAVMGWLVIAVLNIRVTVPLWSDETKLWQWVLRENPDSITAQSHLLTTYMEASDPRAREVAKRMMTENTQCSMCMVNIAYLAVSDGDVQSAIAALDAAKRLSFTRPQDSDFVQAFVLATGQVRELQNNLPEAEEAYRDAISMEPFDPLAQMDLALLLVRKGEIQRGHSEMQRALSLFAPDEREGRRRAFEAALSARDKQSP
jgi:tetratricopeptide (TPR) repeat protein